MTDPTKETLASHADAYRTKKRLPSWRLDPSAVEGSAGALDQSITEHSGRWLYELFQNAEDAGASFCKVRLIGNLIIATDDGKGVPIEAVESLSNPFVSTKNSNDNIGRKGIGFCSVYKLTNAPRIWSNGSGVEFSSEKTIDALRNDSELGSLYTNKGDFPYIHALLPFGFTQLPEQIEKRLGNDSNKGTSVILPLQTDYDTDEILADFEDLESRFLLTFKHLKRITYQRGNKLLWALDKSEEQISDIPSSPKTFKITKEVLGESPQVDLYAIWGNRVQPSSKTLESIKSDKDRERLKSCELSIISPIDHSGKLLPVKEDAPIFVYYPTEQDLPLQLIAHGDFVLDISRKHLIDPCEPNSLNYYLLQELTDLILKVSNTLIQAQRYAEGLQLLRISDDHEAEGLTKLIPNFIQRIQEELLLPTQDEKHIPLCQVIYPGQMLSAREHAIPLISLTAPDAGIAIDALCKTELHQTTKNYSELWFNDAQLFNKLKSKPKFDTLGEQIEWCICAWTWISEAYKKPAGQVYYFGAAHLKELKIIPTQAGVIAAESRQHLPCLVTENSEFHTFPKWLKINAIPKDFSKWVQEHSEQSQQLLESLCIVPFSEAFVVQAFSQAINDESYRTTTQRHQEALDFAKKRNWPDHPSLENFNWSEVKLGKLLLPATQRGELRWVSASTAYFGASWTGLDIESIYQKSTSLTLVSDDLKHEWPHAQSFLKVCRVKASPRVESKDLDERKIEQFWQRIGKNAPQEQKKNRENPRGYHLPPTPTLQQLNGIALNTLDRQSTITLLQLLRLSWGSYYSYFVSRKALLTYNQQQSYTSATNIWFDDLQNELRPPCLKGTLIEQAPLGQLWVKTPDTPDWPLKLFPKLHLKQIDETPEFRNWIIKSGLVRTLVSEIHKDEWNEYIFQALEDLLSETDRSTSKDRARVVSLTYQGFFECIEGGHNRRSIPRACWHRGELRLANDDEKVWAVTTDNELIEWQDDLPVFRFKQNEIKLPQFTQLNYRVLKNQLKCSLILDERDSSFIDETNRIQKLIAWVYADRSNELSKSPPLGPWKGLHTYRQETIRVKKSIGNISREASVPYFYDTVENRLFMTPATLREPDSLATALTEALDLASVADRIEVLLSKDESARRKRMLKDMSESDLDEWLAKYRGEDFEPEEAADIKPPVIPASIPAPAAPKEPNQQQASTEQPSSEPAKDETPAILHSAEVAPVFPDPIAPVARTPEAPRLERPRRAARAQPATTRSSSKHSPRQVPDDAQDVEDRSREFVQQELEAQGYTVTQMEHFNRGYDIDARKDDEVLFVEVKGNKGPTDTVHLTPPELETYKEAAGNSYTWQLWHVSCLAEDSGEQPEIRIYETLAEDALSPEVYTLDLSACQSIKVPEHCEPTPATESPSST